MDPVTLMATITASYNGLKKAVAMGREVQDIVKQLGKWAEGADQMYSWIKNQETKKPGLFQAIKFDKSETAEALDIAAAKLQLQQMEEEIKVMFVYGELSALGSSGYSDFIRSRKEIREKRQRMIRDQIRRRKRFVENAFLAIVVTIATGVIGYLTIAVLMLWFRR
jgi:phage host-nuclease inhibitor protein Gam